MRYLLDYSLRWLTLPIFLTALALSIGCGLSKPADSENEREAASCTEPSNPYSEGTGHYAGYEWAEKNGSGDCNGSSQSFNQGCEEYEAQQSAYEECEAKKRH
jgi:hypothetical protein